MERENVVFVHHQKKMIFAKLTCIELGGSCKCILLFDLKLK